MPCCVDNCQRCAAHFGGFKFPWLGLWNSRGFVLPPDVAPNEAWDYYYQYRESMDFCWWRPTPTSLRHLTWSARSSTRFSSDAQRVTLGSWVWERSSTNGAHGVHGQPRSCQLLSSRAFTQGLPGGRPWPAWGQEGARAHRALCGWLEPKFRCSPAWDSLHRLWGSYKARLLVVLRGDV